MPKILVLDDDLTLNMTMAELLRAEGHVVDQAYLTAEASEFLKQFQYDLLVLDWEVPDGTGLHVIAQFRSNGGLTPILMLTGRSAIEDREKGLDAGADDYLTKPFHERELLARLRALLRRPAMIVNEQLRAGKLVLDTQTRRFSIEGEELKLQPMEYSVLEFFLRNQGPVFSPENIIQRVWGSDTDVSTDAIYSCIKRLRKKLSQQGKDAYIKNVHGVGYQFIAD